MFGDNAELGGPPTPFPQREKAQDEEQVSTAITRRGDARMSPGPLDGVRVLEFSQIVALPFGGAVLSDLGAEVIKVEPLTGDPHRSRGAAMPNEGKRFQSLNRGKQSVAVNLRDPRGLEFCISGTVLPLRLA